MTSPRTPGPRSSGSLASGEGASGAARRVMPPPVTPPGSEVTQLYGPDFAADPYGTYERLREYGALAPVEISPGVGAMLVTDYRAALDLLHDSETWSKDSRTWQQSAPEDSPVMPMLVWRPNLFFSDGETHERYRRAITDSFDRIPPHELRTAVIELADSLIAQFGEKGEADLMTEYARVLPLMLFNRLFGLPDSYSEQLITALAGVWEGRTPEEASAAGAAFEGYIGELMAAKKQVRGEDLTSWFMDHPAGLSDEEVMHHTVITMGAGHEPTANLIANALARMLTDDRYYSTLSGGALTPLDAIHDVLQNEPPIANYSAHFPKRDVYFHGTWIRRGQLVMVSYAAANTQHGRAEAGASGGATGSGGGAHLAWAAGPHSCPVQQPAVLIATTAIERLTAWLSDIELTVRHDQLTYRNGPFHRALTRLPARFTPISPDQPGATPWESRESRPREKHRRTSPAR
ncbi:cytochrome P450 [Streptomyces ovatisporus]|uniref:Cytochrome P450 n=1 Tax=Streptomyces ovatisporus TaxID=1128682 RepID=A0ABV9A6S9_9ACTN